MLGLWLGLGYLHGIRGGIVHIHHCLGRRNSVPNSTYAIISSSLLFVELAWFGFLPLSGLSLGIWLGLGLEAHWVSGLAG